MFKVHHILIVVSLIFCSISQSSMAQISYQGQPYFGPEASLSVKSNNTKQLSYMPSKAHLQESKKQKNGQALTFAHQFTVNYTPDNSGVWHVTDEGVKIWRLSISSPGAYSINLIFDRYKLPKGAKLFIYNTDHSEVIGAFTKKNNKPSGVLATAPVAGDQIIVEYQEPVKAEFKGELLIGAVNHDFLGVHKLLSLKVGFFGDSGSCNEDISCYDENNELDIRRSVGKLIVDGRQLCTATLINNTAQDGKPYIITGSHCYNLDKDGSSTVFYMNYEVPYCSDNIEGTKLHSVSGGTTRVRADSMDIALVELEEVPPAHYRPYYAGWTLNSSPSKPFIGIHHPQGDVKKISTSLTDLIPVTCGLNSGYPDYSPFVKNFHWLVSRWATGTTEAGSSGSGIFDINNKLVGTLSGGEANCTNSRNDYYTQFYKAWDQNSEIDGQFKHWLDPINAGVQSLVGFDPYENDPYLRLTNVENGEKKGVSHVESGGYISGHNAKGSVMFAEHFGGIRSATLKGVYFMPAVYMWGSLQTIDLVVWQGLEAPESIVVREKDIAIKDLKSNKETYIEFTSPVNVTGDFYVGYEINYTGSPVDTFAVYHSINDGKINNSMMVYEGDSWQKASDVYDGVNKSLWIDVLANMVVYGDTQIIPEKDKNILLYPNPCNIDFISIDSKGEFIESCEIFNMNGHRVHWEKVENEASNIPIDITDLSQGVYVMKLRVGEKYTYLKFTKQSY
ncbi:T9SS type A sorting domain-containing protein [Labilibacter sediminis]|nr:T9SS type A sorting domain-containing protein [Labilibacter sediminis]